MATSADIAKVQDLVEDDAVTHGWDAVTIAGRLDAGARPLRIAETYWRKRAQDFLLIVSTSESGSSRGNDVIYDRMVRQADDLAKLASIEEAGAIAPADAGAMGSFPIRRV